MTVLFTPKVSVCIPVYNGSSYIAEAIDSVIGQTYENFELLVCDNCSTDNTEEIVRTFHDSRIKYVRNSDNLGLVGNANSCLSLANGEYVCILHHDDMMLPENLEQKVRLLDENHGVGFVHSNILLIDGEGRILGGWWEDVKQDYIKDGMSVFHEFIMHLPFGARIFIGAVVARRACYNRVGGFNSKLPHCNDSEMWMRMSLFYDVACLGTPLVKWRQHSISESSGFGLGVEWLEEHHLATKIILTEYRDRIPHLENLKKRVFAEFADQAIMKGWRALSRDDFALSKGYLKFAANVHPESIRSRMFWRLATRLLAGPTVVRLCRSGKRLIQRSRD
jgi:glycosyltransferase involved in cell wall biosynthesis